jgi:hypothetical protein
MMSTTGIAGLTLGGGLGWLMSKYGPALDNLQSVEFVTAEARCSGQVRMNTPISSGPFAAGVATSAWQLRSNTSSIRLGLTITGGLVAHPFDRTAATLRFFRDCTASLPDDHTIFAVSFTPPTARPLSWRRSLEGRSE